MAGSFEVEDKPLETQKLTFIRHIVRRKWKKMEDSALEMVQMVRSSASHFWQWKANKADT